MRSLKAPVEGSIANANMTIQSMAEKGSVVDYAFVYIMKCVCRRRRRGGSPEDGEFCRDGICGALHRCQDGGEQSPLVWSCPMRREVISSMQVGVRGGL